MDPARFVSTRAGRVVRVGSGEAAYATFIPAPIPRDLTLPADVVLALSEADRALGRLVGIGGQLPNPHILIQPYLRREAVASTRIEGTQSTLSEVFAAEAQHLPETPDQREVLNYVRALERGLRRLAELPLSNRLIREMHAEVLSGVRGQERTPGDFRTSPNWIGGRGPSDAVFVPPPPDRVPAAMADLEQFLHEDPQLPVLVRCALAHYQFETIHPFLDGNGRLGRLLIVFYLVERRVLPEPLLYISGFLERFRDEYIARLQAVREEGEYEQWIRFFLEAVRAQADAAVETAQSLISLSADYRERLRGIRARGQAVDAAESLIANPYVSAPRLAETLGMTRQGGQYVLATLERAGIITLVRGDRRPTLYVAADVLDALQRDSV